MSRFSRLDDIKSLAYEIAGGRNTIATSDLNWLIERVRKLETVADAAHEVNYRVIAERDELWATLDRSLKELDSEDSAEFADKPSDDDNCICGEINARNCPVHQ